MGTKTNPGKLLPCPFCGSEGEIVKNSFPLRSRWRHPSCSNTNCVAHNEEQDEQGGTHVDFRTDAEAVKAWNTRAAPPSPDREAVLSDDEAAAIVKRENEIIDFEFSAYEYGFNAGVAACIDAIRALKSKPAQGSGFSKDWCLQMAEHEGDQEIGAGFESASLSAAQVERVGLSEDDIRTIRLCADDLEASVNAEYANTLDYPSQARKYKRDLEPVLAVRAIIDRLTKRPESVSEK